MTWGNIAPMPNMASAAPTGQSFCAGSCCDGECITYRAGTVQTQVCCPKPHVLCGATDVGPICCAPNNCQKSPTGKQICCASPLCGGEVCCESPAICQDGLCGIGQRCGNTFCGFAVCCNGVCCDFNQTCVNGKCTTAICLPGQVPCPVTPNQCCPLHFQCCANNTCCDPSETECCGARGCVPMGSCIQ